MKDRPRANSLIIVAAWEIGRTAALARQQKKDVAQAVTSKCGGEVLFRGKIDLVTRKVENGFTQGRCTVVPLDYIGSQDNVDTYLSLTFENEFLEAVLKIAGKADQTLAIVPDLIAFLETGSGVPIGITELRYGLRVTLIALRAPDLWYTPEGLALGGPGQFG
jgi:DUF917 family protein